MRWSIEKKPAAGPNSAYRCGALIWNGSRFIERRPIDTASVGVNRMQHNLETMQCEIESRKVAEA
jgi:hypothetical protein